MRCTAHGNQLTQTDHRRRHTLNLSYYLKDFHALVLVDWHHGSHRAMGQEALDSHGYMHMISTPSKYYFPLKNQLNKPPNFYFLLKNVTVYVDLQVTFFDPYVTVCVTLHPTKYYSTRRSCLSFLQRLLGKIRENTFE